jgi:hypothetical protein
MLLRLRRHLRVNFISDRARHRTLESKNVTQVAIIGLSPQVRISRRVDQLCRNPHPVTGTEHRSFDDSVYSQLPRYFWQGLVCTLITHDRSP